MVSIYDFESVVSSGNPLDYPYPHPSYSFLVDNENILEIRQLESGGNYFENLVLSDDQMLFDYLRQFGISIQELYPVVAYGSNLCPTILFNKLCQKSTNKFLLPTIYATFNDVDIVWSEVPSVGGNHVAYILKDKDYTYGSRIIFGINLLSYNQLQELIRTEPNYYLSRYNNITIGNTTFNSLIFTGKGNIYKDSSTKRPIAVKGLARFSSCLEVMSSKDLFIKQMGQANMVDIIDSYIRDSLNYPEIATVNFSKKAMLMRKINNMYKSDQLKDKTRKKKFREELIYTNHQNGNYLKYDPLESFELVDIAELSNYQLGRQLDFC